MTAEEFIEKNCINGCGDWMLDTVLKEFATLKCQELLEIVADKVSLEHLTPFSGWQRNSYIEENTRVDKDSILNAVNLDEFIN